MKKLFVLALCLATLQTSLSARNDKPIKVDQLPQMAQSFIAKHFSDQKVVMAKEDSEIFETRYDVMFTNGDKLEFNKKGEWVEVSRRTAAVPAAIIPTQIKTFVADVYSNVVIRSIEKDDNRYEIKLSNGMEVTFDNNFNVIDIDD